MGERVCILLCLWVCGLCVVSASVRSVQVGQNITLPCNLTASPGSEITWYQLRSEDLLPLLTVKRDKVDNSPAVTQNSELDHYQAVLGDICPGSLQILAVKETDQGLYFCAGRGVGVWRFQKGIRLSLSYGGVGERAEPPPCWILLACIAPASALLSCLCVLGLCFRTAGGASVCSRCVNGDPSLKEMDLHYASLKHSGKPRPAAQGEPPLAQEDVTYATVAHRVNPGA